MIAVRAQATPEPPTRAAHARVPTLTPPPDRTAPKNDRPYGLARQGYTYAEIGRLVGRDWRTVKRYR